MHPLALIDWSDYWRDDFVKQLLIFLSLTFRGLGLGLPHAKRVVTAQGGEIFLRNPEGGGAEVEIVLPTAG